MSNCGQNMEVCKSPDAKLMMKLKTKQLVTKLKSGSPKFQEVLRERCKERMKERRSELFNRRRLLLDDGNETNDLTEIIRKELQIMTTVEKDQHFDPGETLSIEEALAIENEILEEEQKWMMAEYERILQEEDQLIQNEIENEMRQIAFCPVCQKAALQESFNCIKCTSAECGFLIPGNYTVEMVKTRIDAAVEKHWKTNCPFPPNFVQDDAALLLFCGGCFNSWIV